MRLSLNQKRLLKFSIKLGIAFSLVFSLIFSSTPISQINLANTGAEDSTKKDFMPCRRDTQDQDHAQLARSKRIRRIHSSL